MKNELFLSSLLFVCVGNVSAKSEFSLPSGVHVAIDEEKFERGQFHVSGCTDESKLCLVNGHIPFGVAESLPKTYIRSIVVAFSGHSYSLNASDMYDAWNARPLAMKGVRYFGGRCSDARNCQFRGVFSDGAASFVAEWRIVDGYQIRTVLSDSRDIVDLFIHNIDPPEY